MHRTVAVFVLAVLSFCLLAMESRQNAHQQKKQTDSLTIMSYNVENLFDTIDNAQTEDDDFTPMGTLHWTKQRYHIKLRRLAQVISRVGGRKWPALVCLVEVENASVIKDLLFHTALGHKAGYKYSITHSSDPRGIDVAILYQPQVLQLLGQVEHTVQFMSQEKRKSRNVLELSFALHNGEKLCVMGVHWPSRREGADLSEPLRCEVARLMRQRCDDLYRGLSVEERDKTHFLLMGDFNEEDHEPAIKEELGAMRTLFYDVGEDEEQLRLYSLMNHEIEGGRIEQPYGSYCFQGVWTQLDHFILSESLFNPRSHLRYRRGSARNYYAPFLGTEHRVAGYRTPRRTYAGTHYVGGYSDHYPICMTLDVSEK